MPRLKKSKKCEPDCPHGLDVFNDPWRIGRELWVEIEKCDDCPLYESDDEAAYAVAVAAKSVAFYLDVDTGDMYPISDPWKAAGPGTTEWMSGGWEGDVAPREHDRVLRCLVPAEAAVRAGLIDSKVLQATTVQGWT